MMKCPVDKSLVSGILPLMEPTKSATTPTNEAVQSVGGLLGNNTPHNFATLAEQFLRATKVLHQHDKEFGFPARPTYFLAFQALELYLKAFLAGKGMPGKDLQRRIGHSIRKALEEAKLQGLPLPNIDDRWLQALLDLSDAYQSRTLQYRSNHRGMAVLPGDLIEFVNIVCRKCGYTPPSV